MTNKEKSNSISSDVSNYLLEFEPNKEEFLSFVSSILCELDTDIAIGVMNNFGKEGKEQALAIKINHGY